MLAAQTPTPVLTLILDSVLPAISEQPQRFGLAGHHIICILNALDTRADIEASAIARYEWIYLPLLRHDRTLRLHEELTNAPDLFAQMIAAIYRAGDEVDPPPATQEEIARAHHADDLLSSWRNVPGKMSDGTIDSDALMAWVERARAQCSSRLDGCDNYIGKMLAHAPQGADGMWPCEGARVVIEHGTPEPSSVDYTVVSTTGAAPSQLIRSRGACKSACWPLSTARGHKHLHQHHLGPLY